MRKIIIILSLVCLNLFGATYTHNNKSVILDTYIKENYTYINTNNLDKFGVNLKINGNKIILTDKKVTIEFLKSKKAVKVNSKFYELSNSPIIKDTNIYVDFNFVLEVLNYSLSGTEILKANNYGFPLKEDNYSVSKEPKKIISLAPGVTEKLYELGAFGKLAGRTDYCLYPVEVKNIPSVGTMYGPAVEKIIELKPDLVIAETHFNEKVLNKLKEAGIEVFAVSASNNFDEMFRFIKKLGFITGKEFEGRALVASLKNKIQRTKYVLKDIKDKPAVYYAVGAGKGDYTAGRDTFMGELIRTVGAQNVGDIVTGWSFSLEKLMETNPKIIFGSKYSIDIMNSNNAYAGLSAIKNKNYFIVDENIFNLSGPRLINQGIKILVEKFHGNKAKELGF